MAEFRKHEKAKIFRKPLLHDSFGKPELAKQTNPCSFKPSVTELTDDQTSMPITHSVFIVTIQRVEKDTGRYVFVFHTGKPINTSIGIFKARIRHGLSKTENINVSFSKL